MPDQPRPGLDQRELHTPQGPFRDGLGPRQPPQEVTQVIGQAEELPPHLVGHTPMTRPPRPLHRVLPRLHPRLGSPSSIVEVHDALRLGRQVGAKETHPRAELSLVPFHVRDHPPGTLPARRLVPEVVIPDEGLLWWSPHRPLQQGLNPLRQHLITGEPDGIEEAMFLQVLLELRAGKSRIGPNVQADPNSLIGSHDRLQHLLPAMGAMDIPRRQHRSLAVPKLIEADRSYAACFRRSRAGSA
jgi:hypothetical protein